MKQGQFQYKELRFPVPWGHVAAKAWGSPTAKPALMVHGSLDNAGSFDRLIPLLPSQYYFVCIDLPGHGYSSHFSLGVPLEFFNYVYCIHIILNTLGWKTCAYIGHSLGGQIGVFFSILYPERLEKIISLDGLIPLPFDTYEKIARLREIYDVTRSNNNGVSHLYTKEEILYALKYMRKSTLTSSAANALFTRAVTKVGNKYTYNRDPRMKVYVRPLMSFQDFFAYLKLIPIPVLLLAADGSTDKYRMTEVLETLSSLKDKCKVHVIFIHGNHDVHNNYPERVAPYICSYLNNNMLSKL